MRIGRATLFTLLVVAVAVAVTALLQISGRRSDPAPESGAAVLTVRTISLERRALPGEVRSGGFLRARADITISAERGGRILSLPVPEGGRVEAGRPVAHLEDTLARANLARARAAAREAALAPQLDAAERERAQSDLSIAEHELSLHHPVSPIDGRVEQHHVDEGEYVRAGAPLVDVIDATVLVLDVEVDGEVVGALAPDREVGVVVSGVGAEVSGRITRIANRAGRSTRRFRVEISIPAGSTPLRAGMHAGARFVLPGGEPGLFLSKASVREARGESGVFVVRDGRATWVPVRVEAVFHRSDLWRLVGGELREGDRIVARGFGGLRDGIPVRTEP
jgi:multidrug efflux pump subunit AcrA (membrane-fusion protein)